MSDQEFSLWCGDIQLTGENPLGYWEVDEFEGWWGTPEPKGPVQEWPDADGDMVTPVRYGPRYITVRGAFVAGTHALREAGINALTSMLSTGPQTMRVAMDGRSTYTRVVRSSPIEVEVAGWRLVNFEFQAKAPDPRRYGEFRSVPVAAGSPALVQNRGNYPASPVIRVPGPLPVGGYTITGPAGEQYTVTASPGSSSVHTIKMDDGLLRINGSISAGSGYASRADTFTVPAGEKVEVKLSSGSGAVEIVDTYM